MANTKQQRDRAKAEKLGLVSIMIDGKYIGKDKVEISGCCSKADHEEVFKLMMKLIKRKTF